MNLPEKHQLTALAAACFFGGMVAGFLLAPIKRGVYCGNNNGNTYRGLDEEPSGPPPERDDAL